MTTKKQKKAAKENIKKAARARAQPEGRKRKNPGVKGEGDYYRIVVRDKRQFISFRTHDVGDPGGIQRIAGHRKSGSWDTQTWLISKDRAHTENGTLVAGDEDVQGVFDQLGSKPAHVKGDIYEANPRPNAPEKEKPTEAQKKARQENIQKAQEARWDS